MRRCLTALSNFATATTIAPASGAEGLVWLIPLKAIESHAGGGASVTQTNIDSAVAAEATARANADAALRARIEEILARLEPVIPPDTTPPTASITASKISSTTGESVTFTVNASDDVGVTTWSFEFDGVEKALDSNHQVTVTMPSTAGTYTATAEVADAAGNRVQVSQSVTVTIPPDTTPPEVSISASTMTSYWNENVTFYIDASDAKGVVRRTLTVHGIDYEAGTSGATSLVVTMPQIEGNVNATVAAWDAAGNVKRASVSVSVAKPLLESASANHYASTTGGNLLRKETVPAGFAGTLYFGGTRTNKVRWTGVPAKSWTSATKVQTSWADATIGSYPSPPTGSGASGFGTLTREIPAGNCSALKVTNAPIPVAYTWTPEILPN